jgi:hypothetical protein
MGGLGTKKRAFNQEDNKTLNHPLTQYIYLIGGAENGANQAKLRLLRTCNLECILK